MLSDLEKKSQGQPAAANMDRMHDEDVWPVASHKDCVRSDRQAVLPDPLPDGVLQPIRQAGPEVCAALRCLANQISG